jgi:hypothetical protein
VPSAPIMCTCDFPRVQPTHGFTNSRPKRTSGNYTGTSGAAARAIYSGESPLDSSDSPGIPGPLNRPDAHGFHIRPPPYTASTLDGAVKGNVRCGRQGFTLGGDR